MLRSPHLPQLAQEDALVLLWVGRLFRNPDPRYADDPQLEVWFGRLRPEEVGSILHARLSWGEITKRPVAVYERFSVTLLSFLEIGSVWRQGDLLGAKPGRVEILRLVAPINQAFTVSASAVEEPFEGRGQPETPGGSPELEEPSYYIPRSYFNVPGAARSARLVRWWTSDTTARGSTTTPSSGPATVVLCPGNEIIRFFFGGSPRFLQHLFLDGLRQGAGKILNPDRERTFRVNDELVTVRLRPTVPNADAPLVARIAFDDAFRRNAHQIADSMAFRIHPEMEKNYAFPWCGVPSNAPCDVQAKGVLIHTAARTRVFLITRIVTCALPAPFKVVVPTRDNDGRKGESFSEELGKAWANPDARPAPEVPPGANPAPVSWGEVDRDTAPAKVAYENLLSELATDESVQVLVLPKGESRFERADPREDGAKVGEAVNTNPEGTAPAGEGTTVRGQFVDGGMILGGVPHPDDATEPVAKRFLWLLRAIAQRRDYGFTYLCLNPPEPDDRINSQFPPYDSGLLPKLPVRDPKKTKADGEILRGVEEPNRYVVGWLQIPLPGFTKENPICRPRRFYLCQIFDPNSCRYHYLIELELARGMAGGETTHHLALVHGANAREPLSPDLLLLLMSRCARVMGRWGRLALAAFSIQPVKHDPAPRRKDKKETEPQAYTEAQWLYHHAGKIHDYLQN